VEKFNNHTFVIAAYKESQYLEECINSLLKQTVKSNIIISTSTPNDYISDIAQKYNIELFINPESKGIGPDWNFAVQQCNTDFVTVVHQDDVYNKKYTECVKRAIEKYNDIVMIYTNGKEIRNGKIVKKNINLKIKALLVIPTRIFKRSKFAKKLTLYFGNSISCPSVTLNTKIVGKNPYMENMKSNIDWETWIEFIKYKGAFVYLKEELTYHRVHSESETSRCIKDNKRLEEDRKVFCKLWPKCFVKFIMFFYKHAVDVN
jgi:glycosyltransferase involved in cell wall biosynthesis